MSAAGSKPLEGTRVVELAGIGPAPLASTMLADMGCEVVRIERVSASQNALDAQLSHIGVRPRPTLALDLKSVDGLAVAVALIDRADVLIEGFRPGTTERLGLGPDRFTESNPGLVYVRLTGWGQEGPYSMMAGHDINYIGVTGALAAIGTREHPIPPLNLLGDYAGGSMFAIMSTLAVLVQRSRTGRGAVIDAAMVDGVSDLLTPIRDLASLGAWVEDRSSNLLDGGAPFYRTYETSDGGFMAVGALEPVFYSEFVAGLGIAEEDLPNRFDPSNWQQLADTFSEAFLTAPRDHWQSVFDDTDACVTPVLTMSETAQHTHMRSRANDPVVAEPEADVTRSILSEAGLSDERIYNLVRARVLEIRD